MQIERLKISESVGTLNILAPTFIIFFFGSPELVALALLILPVTSASHCLRVPQI